MAAQSISFLGRIAFFMRGHTATKVWPAGHLLSSHEERRQRRAKGVPPWNPQAACRFSPHENRRGRRLLNQRYTRRGPGPPGVWAVIMIYFYLSSVGGISFPPPFLGSASFSKPQPSVRQKSPAFRPFFLNSVFPQFGHFSAAGSFQVTKSQFG